jgi:hypothetical protein
MLPDVRALYALKNTQPGCAELTENLPRKACMPFTPHPAAIRVRLTADLTGYRAGLVPGTLGWTDPVSRAPWGVYVEYDNGVRLDTLWKSLEQLEPETQAHRRQLKLGPTLQAVADLVQDGMAGDDLKKQLWDVIKEASKARRRQERAAAKPAAK